MLCTDESKLVGKMTVTRATSLLYVFRSKIEEAVSFVPRMSAEEKLKAVQFWNIVSEKLQDIVNNSAADINAIALKMGGEDSEKITMEISNTADSNIISHHSISSDFINLSAGYAVCSSSESQYHTSEMNSTNLKHLLSSESSFTNTADQSLNNVANMPHIGHLSSTIEPCEKINNQSEFLTVQNLPTSNCDNFSIDPHCASEISGGLPCISSVKSHSNLNKDSSSSLQEKDDHSESTQGSEQSSNNENCDINIASSNSCLSKNGKISKRSNIKCPLMKNLGLSSDNMMKNAKNKLECEKEADIHSSVSENSCADKSEFDSIVNLDESSESNSAEHIVSFVVSNSEEILAKNEIRHEKSCEENLNQNETFICKECGKEFSDSSSLSSHCWLHNHKPFSCADCQADFSTKGNLVVHMRKHTGEKPYPCSKCSARFSTKGNQKRHLKTHTGEKPFQCNRCGGRFTEKKSLTVHMRRHTGERPYNCKVCGKNFAQTGILHTHMAMHLDLKVHLCEHCGKSFRQKSQLRIHKLRHENVRRYECPVCPARFLTKGDMERHRRMHTGERPFSCDMCNKTFTRQQSLNEHMNRHYGLRPYLCKYCSKTFAEMSACYKHIKQHEKTKDASDLQSTQTENSEQPLDSSLDNFQAFSTTSCENKLPIECKETSDKNSEIELDSLKESSREKTLTTPFIHIFMQ